MFEPASDFVGSSGAVPDYNRNGGYGCWRDEGGQPPTMPLPWNEGSGNSKAELAELSADASPLELGDWLAVCGPVLSLQSAPGGGTSLHVKLSATMNAGRRRRHWSGFRSRHGCLMSCLMAAIRGRNNEVCVCSCGPSSRSTASFDHRT